MKKGKFLLLCRHALKMIQVLEDADAKMLVVPREGKMEICLHVLFQWRASPNQSNVRTMDRVTNKLAR